MTRAEAKTALIVARVLSVCGAAIAWLAAGLGAWIGTYEPAWAFIPMAVLCAVAASVGLEIDGCET